MSTFTSREWRIVRDNGDHIGGVYRSEREARDQLATMRSQDHNVTLQYREKHVTVNDWTGE